MEANPVLFRGLTYTFLAALAGGSDRLAVAAASDPGVRLGRNGNQPIYTWAQTVRLALPRSICRGRRSPADVLHRR